FSMTIPPSCGRANSCVSLSISSSNAAKASGAIRRRITSPPVFARKKARADSTDGNRKVAALRSSANEETSPAKRRSTTPGSPQAVGVGSSNGEGGAKEAISAADRPEKPSAVQLAIATMPPVLERQVLRIRLVPLDVQTLRGRALPAPRDHLRREVGRDHGRSHPRRGDRDVSGPGRDVEHRRARPDVAGLREHDRLGEDRLRDRAIVAEPPHRRGAPLQLIEIHRPASSPSGVASLAPTALARHRQGGQRSASNLVPSVTPARDQDVLLSAVPDRGRPEPPLARRLGVEMGAWREDRRAGGE